MTIAACAHTGRVLPVVWRMTPDGEVPQIVVCEQCWRPIDANEPQFNHYEEDDDGWFRRGPIASHEALDLDDQVDDQIDER